MAVVSSQRRIIEIDGVRHSTVLVLLCTECARIEIHDGKLVGQDNSRVEDMVGLRMKSVIARGGTQLVLMPRVGWTYKIMLKLIAVSTSRTLELARA